MRTFIFLLCTTVFSFSSDNVFSQQKVNIDQDQLITVDQVFKIIKKQTDYRFIYPKNIFKQSPKVQLIKGEILVTDLLEQTLSNSQLDFELADNNTIVINSNSKEPSENSPEETSQENNISGSVTDEEGNPVVGANILIEGTTRGTMTDFDGNFTIGANQGDVLIFSVLGMKAQRVVLEENVTTLNISLEVDTANLEEIIVVGYGSQLISNVSSGSVKIDPEVLESRPITSVQQGLAGVDPSLRVNFSGGRPGSSPNLTIRGEGSPLTLVDGFPANMGDVDPNTIETFTILKDASATAIYGLDGAYGVILITTKKGNKNTAPSFKYEFQVSSQDFTSIPKLANTVDYMLLRNQAVYNNEVYAPGSNVDPADGNRFGEFSEDVLARARAGEFPNTDWTSLVYSEPAIQFNHSLAVSGGSEKTIYNVTLGYVDQDGVNVSEKFDNYKRFNLRSRIQTEINDWFTTGVNIAYTHSAQNTVPIETERLLRAVPLYPVKDDDPLIGLESPSGLYAYGDGGSSGNPMQSSTDGSFNQSLRDALQLQLNLSFKLYKGLTFDQNINYSLTSTDNTNWTNAAEFATLNFDGQTGEYTPDNVFPAQSSDRKLSLSAFRNVRLQSQSLLNYKNNFGNHNIGALAGFEIQKVDRNSIGNSRSDFLNDAVISLELGDPLTQTTSHNQSDERKYSFFGRMNYNYKGKYIVEAAFRNDYDGRFADGYRSGFFPSFSGAWNIHKEDFMGNFEFLNTLKLSGGWGEVGDTGGRDLSHIAAVNVNNGYPFLNGVVPGLTIANYPNPELSWETIQKSDLRLDVELFKRKLGIYTNFYQNDRSDIIMLADVGNTFGLPAPSINSTAVTRRKGWEIMVKHKNKIGDFSYNISANVGNSQNRWEDLGNLLENDINSGAGSLRQEGEIVGIGLDFISDGLIRDQEDLDSYLANHVFDGPSLSRIQVGMPKLTDISGPDGVPDGSIDFTYDRRVSTSRKGRYNVGGQFGFGYKGFSLSGTVTGNLNVTTTITGAQAGNQFSGGVGNAYDVHNLSFNPDNPNVNAPFPLVQLGQFGYGDTDYIRHDSDYIRMANLNLKYDFDSALLEKIKFFKSIQVFVSAENPFIIWNNFFATDYGWDPELGFGAAGYPLPRTFSIGANITF